MSSCKLDRVALLCAAATCLCSCCALYTSDPSHAQLQELERTSTAARKDAEAAEQSLTALHMQAKADADRASDLARRKDAEIAELHAHLQQAQVTPKRVQA